MDRPVSFKYIEKAAVDNQMKRPIRSCWFALEDSITVGVVTQWFWKQQELAYSAASKLRFFTAHFKNNRPETDRYFYQSAFINQPENTFTLTACCASFIVKLTGAQDVCLRYGTYLTLVSAVPEAC